jgi:hypothetical protein
MTRPALPVGAHGDWQLLAQMHRPPDITEAVRRLAAQGLKPHDIAAALRIGVAAVEQALREVAA